MEEYRMTAPIKAVEVTQVAPGKWRAVVSNDAAMLLGFARGWTRFYGSWESATALQTMMQDDLNEAWREAHAA